MSRGAAFARCELGQATILVTLALFAMAGMIGLAVDLGWSYYVKKTARAAADGAALAAVREVLAGNPGPPPYTCSTTGITCQSSPVSCASATGNLAVGCDYATGNGFAAGGHDGHQSITISANVSASTCFTASPPSCVPAAPGVAAYYWVHVVATETVPQLFSALEGNASATVSADGTAAVVDTIAVGSLRLLDRENETNTDGNGKGVDLYMGGGGSVAAPGGITLASNASGAGFIKGSSSVTAPFTYIRGSGTAATQGAARWTAPFTNNKADGKTFYDPLSSKDGQPPLYSGSLPYIAVPSGTLNSTVCPGGVCPQGIYYATGYAPSCGSSCTLVATGAPISFASNLSFTASATWNEYVFFGGMNVGANTVNFGPGRYVLAGVNTAYTTDLFNTQTNTNIDGGSGSDAGRIFILTDSSYGGNSVMTQYAANIPLGKSWGPTGSLVYGDFNTKSGNNGSSITLYGLDPGNTDLPADLEPFAPLVIWQDQGNSSVLYNSNGQVDYASCGSGHSLDNPCAGAAADAQTGMILYAGQNTHLHGVIYQPRGAWLEVHSGSGYGGPLQIVTGALSLQGGPTLTLTGPANPLTITTAALVE